jgi:hypothetical protein
MKKAKVTEEDYRIWKWQVRLYDDRGTCVRTTTYRTQKKAFAVARKWCYGKPKPLRTFNFYQGVTDL